MASLSAINPMRTYADIACPTLIVHSELDPIPADWSRMLADTIPGADYVLLEGANHFAMIEDSDAYARRSFRGSISATPDLVRWVGRDEVGVLC